MKRYVFCAAVVAVLLTVAVPSWGKVVGREVAYRSGDTLLKGYLAQDSSVKGKRPAVLVVHEWWGLNDYARRRARMLARMGYVALAVDMYGNGTTAANPRDAGRLAAEVTKHRGVETARFGAALEFIRKQPSVDPTRIAAIGYCFGGGVVLQMAREGADLKGVVSFHGDLATDSPAQPGKVKARVLVFSGDADSIVPPGQVAAFTEEMVRAGVRFRLVGYPGALHSFTNPDADRFAKEFKLPLAYDREADRDSWRQTGAFLREIFRNG